MSCDKQTFRNITEAHWNCLVQKAAADFGISISSN